MPLICYHRKTENRCQLSLFAKSTPEGKAQADVVSSFIEKDTGETSSLAATKSCYENLPDHLKSCFDYCAIVSEHDAVSKRKLARLLLAQGLIPEKPGEILEDLAENIIDQLTNIGLLVWLGSINVVRVYVPNLYRTLCVGEVEEQDFVIKAANWQVHAVFKDGGQDLPPNFKNLQIQSLFATALEVDSTGSYHTVEFSQVYMETACGLKFMLVLDLDGDVDYLPDQVGDLIHLRYLGLRASRIKKLPRTVGNLQKLQTLNVSCRNMRELPVEILNLRQLRHLLINKSYSSFFVGVRVPKGIGTLVNLQTCTVVHVGAGVAIELSNLTQLRELGIWCLSDFEDYASELFAVLMEMKNLVSLSLRAEKTCLYSSPKKNNDLLPEMEAFSPPPHLQELYLYGRLIEIPNWLVSMENLIRLDLLCSNLLRNPSSVLQYLPKLKSLTLWYAYEAKLIGKEFCEVGGFPKLENLTICSEDLVEWSEIVNGAFPSLSCLRFYNCVNLRFLPEGLQNISTIQKLYLMPSHEDLARRLSGEENYKIKHVSRLVTRSPKPNRKFWPS